MIRLALVALLLACGAAKPAAPAPAAPVPESFAALGTPCDAAAARPFTMTDAVICSAAGQVAGVYRPADFLHRPPAGAAVLSAQPDLQFVSTPYLAVEGERIWIRRVTCGDCRRVGGWSFIGDLPALSDAELARLQRLLGFDAAVPPLRTAAAWRAQPLPPLDPPR